MLLTIAVSSWTQEIVWEILHYGRIDNRPLDERTPLIEGMILALKSNPYITEDAKSVEKKVRKLTRATCVQDPSHI